MLFPSPPADPSAVLKADVLGADGYDVSRSNLNPTCRPCCRALAVLDLAGSSR